MKRLIGIVLALLLVAPVSAQSPQIRQLMLRQMPAVAAGGGPPTFSGTDARTNDSAGFAATVSFTTVNIGTASATRVVVVGVGGYLGGTVASVSAVTVNGVSLTHAVSTANTTNLGELWYGVVASGTSVTVAVTASAGGWQFCDIAVGVLDHVTTAPTLTGSLDAAGSQNSPYLLSSITVPSTGFGITYAFVANGTATITSSNTTIDQQANGTSTTSAMSHTAVAGAIQPSFTAGNFLVVEMVGATWGP